VLFSFLFPIKAKYFVLIIGVIAFLSSFGASTGGVSHMAHLGGMIFGLVYLKRRSLSLSLLASRRPRVPVLEAEAGEEEVRGLPPQATIHTQARPWIN